MSPQNIFEGPTPKFDGRLRSFLVLYGHKAIFHDFLLKSKPFEIECNSVHNRVLRVRKPLGR